MKILITISNSTKKIVSVHSCNYYIEKGKTMEQIEDAVLKANSADTNYWKYQIVKIPDSMEHVMYFLLGEKEYKVAGTINSLKEKVQDCIDDIEEMKTSLYDMSNYFEDVANDLKKFCKDNKE